MTHWIAIAYLVAATLFIFGLKGLTHPRTAVRGNLMGAIGMLIAVIAVLLDQGIVSYGGLIGGLLVGSVVGAVLAVRVQMTAMPQLVAIFNGFGGAASLLVAAGDYTNNFDEFTTAAVSTHAPNSIAIAMAALIGGVTFTGSLIAFAKLQELISGNVYDIPGIKAMTGILVLVSVGLSGYMLFEPSEGTFWILSIVSSVLGVALVLRIGGADMPVVIALLNSYSGLAAAAAGFVLQNTALIISGSLVGASGLILTAIMCKAMNRSIWNVFFGGTAQASGDQDDIYSGKIKETSADEVAILLDAAQRVVFVPGYGMAVAQAQHAVRELTNQLKKRDCTVEFAIHPVAGRMPGHMNVLLAEVDIPYEDLKEMEEINPTFTEVDVAIVLGANDVVNPVARDDPGSPIAGMPIIDVDKARTVIVIKRSLSPGFAGIPNPLFVTDHTLMYFGDGKSAVMEMVQALEEY